MRKELIQTEEPMAKKLESFGWKFAPASKLIEDYSEPLITSILKSAIRRLNSVNDEEVEEVINYLKTRFFDVEGCKAVLEALKNGVAVKDRETGVIKRIKLIDYENPENNEFIFSRQVYYKGLKADIPDIVLYINGIPIVIIECKKMSESWKKAYSQVKRYEKEVPELFKYVQFSVAMADKAVYFPNVRWLKDVPAYEWQELDFLKKSVLLDILRYFIFYREDKGEWTKVLPRYMQYRAVNKIVNRAVKYVRREGDRNKGLIWHWQGSGKTLTMIFAAYKIQEILGNPTIFFIVDRIDLQEQLSNELKSVGLSFEVVGSIPHLRKILTHADGKRGFFVTLIHKFREEELKELREELKKTRSIVNRRDVIAFVDEGHRSQYGDLAATMRSILKNAAFFAFTGTPIAKRGRDTYAAFGYTDEPYLDRYFILDSIRDGFTVKIAYQARLDSEHLDKESLNIFLTSKLEEIEEEYREQVEEELKKKLNAIRVILENPRRIERVARDIAAHYQSVKPFKAMVVAVSRKACVRYKRALDKYMPPEWTEIVMTFNQDDPEEIQEYLRELIKKYGNMELKEIREEIVKKFKKEENPKILIVTDMLLTGFDAPILQTMYLDKPLKEHRLLQAIARTNRPLFKDGENVKPAGLIIDYIGVFGELEKALAIYDEADIAGVAYDVDEIKEELNGKIEEALKLFNLPISYDRDTIETAIVKLEEKDVGEHFKKLYREIRNLYRLLIEERLEFKEKFDWLTEIYYAYHRRVKGIDPELEQKKDRFMEEALKFIHETIDIEKIRKDFPIVEINEEFLKKVAREDKSKRFYDLLFAVRSYIERGEILDEDIVNRVERIVKDWREREKGVEELYADLDSIAKKIHMEREERKSLGIGKAEYEILKLLRKRLNLDDESLINDAVEIKKLVEEITFPGWSGKGEVVNEVSQKILLYLIRKYKGDITSIRKLRDEIVELLKKVM